MAILQDLFSVSLTPKGQETIMAKASEWTPDWLERLIPTRTQTQTETVTQYVEKPVIDKKLIAWGAAAAAGILLIALIKKRR